jgi:hypothetical protein
MLMNVSNLFLNVLAVIREVAILQVIAPCGNAWSAVVRLKLALLDSAVTSSAG